MITAGIPQPTLYCVRSGQHIKIGHTTDLERRMGELQCGSALFLELLLAIPGEVEDERAVHAKFKHLRVRGEWFIVADDLLAWIEAARETGSVR